jgi:hypothetical protein
MRSKVVAHADEPVGSALTPIRDIHEGMARVLFVCLHNAGRSQMPG